MTYSSISAGVGDTGALRGDHALVSAAKRQRMRDSGGFTPDMWHQLLMGQLAAIGTLQLDYDYE